MIRGKIHALQIATESSIRSMQEQSKKLVTGKLKEVAYQKIDEQTEALYELITMVTQKNNFHEFETYNIFLWIFKAYVAIYLVTNTFNITMAVFDVGQRIVNGAAGVISGSTAVDASAAIATLTESLEEMEIGAHPSRFRDRGSMR